MKKLGLYFMVLSILGSAAHASRYKTILLTGGNGYIGSHIAVELLREGYHVLIMDSLVNSNPIVLERIRKITGKDREVEFFANDLRDQAKVNEVFRTRKIDAVIHLAGLKAVGESVENPLLYYNNNIISSLYLLEAMDKFGCNNLIFSSSATVYGIPEVLPLTETHPLSAINPYGRTKLQIEEIMGDVATSNKKWRFISLRYFNPSGSHPSGEIGEDPQGIPNNLMPYLLQVVVGKRDYLNVFGGDYNTKDGTGVRDYIHVVDLAQGHLATLHKLEKDEDYRGHKVYNLGTGTGYSVLDILKAVQKANGDKTIQYKMSARRQGDAAEVVADPSLANKELKWKAKFGIEDMARDSLNWILKNPNGYKTGK